MLLEKSLDYQEYQDLYFGLTRVGFVKHQSKKQAQTKLQVPTYKEVFRALALKWNLVFSPISPNSKIHNKGSYHFFQNIHPCFLHIVDITIEQWYMEIVGKYCTRIYKHLFISCGGHLRVTSVGYQVTYYLKEPCRQLASS